MDLSSLSIPMPAALIPARCVLLVGDEALHIYDVMSRGSKLVGSVPWREEGFEEAAVKLIREESGRRSVLVVNDMTDQHFKGGQRLPKVGPMDQANVVKRKLQVAFPNYTIRGYLAIKELRGERPAGEASQEFAGAARLGGLYLFAAVSMSEPIAKTMEVIKRAALSVSGFYLLPVESADMVRALAGKLAKDKEKPARWAIFMGQHQSGSLRQIITRDGQLAMTRMTPVVDSDSDAERWANEVAQEFKATISYLSRFGYSAQDQADVIAIANPHAGDSLERLLDVPCRYTSLSVGEAARILGMNIGVQEEGRYADSLHAAWIGRKSSFAMPMKTPELARVYRPRQYATAAIVLLLASAAFLSWQAFSQFQSISSLSADLKKQKQILAGAEVEHQVEIDRMDKLGINVKLIQGAIAAYEGYSKSRLDPLPFLKKIGMALGGDMHLDHLKIDVGKVTKDETATDPMATGPVTVTVTEVRTVLRLSFPPSLAPEEGVRQINSLAGRLKTAMPGYSVDIQKQVADLTYAGSVRGRVGDATRDQASKQDYTAEIMIKGPPQ